MLEMTLVATRHETPLPTLVELAASGDTEAFEQLMIQTQTRVMAMTWRMLGNDADARDATQEVFLRVYKNLGRIRQDRDLFAWLYRVSVNVCRDIARSRRRHVERFAPLETDVAAPGAADSAVRELTRREERERVARAIATLPDKERAAILLRDVEGLPTEEVAKILESSATTVRSQISSARKKLRSLLGGGR
jgi:RNA polymerase sigma-70 factor (ECF subfamily)